MSPTDDDGDPDEWLTNFHLRRKLVSTLADRIPRDQPVTFALALKCVATAKRDVVNSLAALELVASLRALRRAEVLKLEQAAERRRPRVVAPPPPPPHDPNELTADGGWMWVPGRPNNPLLIRHGSMAKYDGGAYWHCPCGSCRRSRESDEEVTRKFREKMAKITEDYVTTLKIEWTQELLDSVFALPDGTLVLWGEATVEQHTVRRNMLQHNAIKNIEAAARHEQAISTLTESHALNLREVVQTAA